MSIVPLHRRRSISRSSDFPSQVVQVIMVLIEYSSYGLLLDVLHREIRI